MTVRELAIALNQLPEEQQDIPVVIEVAGAGACAEWNEVVSRVYLSRIGSETVSFTEKNPNPDAPVIRIAS